MFLMFWNKVKLYSLQRLWMMVIQEFSMYLKFGLIGMNEFDNKFSNQIHSFASVIFKMPLPTMYVTTICFLFVTKQKCI